MNTESVQKIFSGEPIGDDELRGLINFLQDLVSALEVMGPEYALARRDARSKLETCKGFLYARFSRDRR